MGSNLAILLVRANTVQFSGTDLDSGAQRTESQIKLKETFPSDVLDQSALKRLLKRLNQIDDFFLSAELNQHLKVETDLLLNVKAF